MDYFSEDEARHENESKAIPHETGYFQLRNFHRERQAVRLGKEGVGSENAPLRFASFKEHAPGQSPTGSPQPTIIQNQSAKETKESKHKKPMHNKKQKITEEIPDQRNQRHQKNKETKFQRRSHTKETKEAKTKLTKTAEEIHDQRNQRT